MVSTPLTDDELPALFESISNWGRWGADDERGTINLITPDVTARAAAEIREGVTIGCGTLDLSGRLASPEPPTQHVMLNHGEETTQGFASATDYIGVDYHGSHSSHLDALNHVFWDGRMYNDRPAALVKHTGAEANTIDVWGDGIATRGVLLDIPALRGTEWIEPLEPVLPAELDAAAARQGVEVREGDALLVYTGRAERRAAVGSDLQEGVFWIPGLDGSCLPWLHEHGIAILCNDGVNDALPRQAGDVRVPLHVGALVFMGLPLIDNAALRPLVAACRERSRWEFFFTVAPLRFEGGTGCPVNPIAIF